MFKKYFLYGLRNIRHRELRSWLTIIGIIIGVALIVSLISLGKGLENTVLQQLRMFGADLVYILPGEETDPLLGVLGGGSFRESELEVLKGVPGVDVLIPFDIEFVTLEFKGEQKSTLIHGSPMKETMQVYTASRGLGLEAGEWPDREGTNEILLGNKIAHDKFREPVYVGDEIRIKGKVFRVVGILNEMGSSEDDNAVYMSLKTLEKITGSASSYMMILATTIDGYEPATIAEEIKYRLQQKRGSADFTVLTAEQTEDIVSDVIGSISLAILFIAIFSIIVGGIGVMNTMYTSVLERRREIGIMKAIGATNNDVLMVFMFESGIIGVIGGVIGASIGLGLAKTVEVIAYHSGFKLLTIYVSAEFIGGTLLFAFLIGVLSGTLPAREASRLNPAEALRYE